jgi:GTP-binding protein HflX
LSDTVGFISDLPTHLVAAFRATLEEVLEADVIIHVRDIAHAETEIQKQDVLAVLASLGVDEDDRDGMIEACNKYEMLTGEEKLRIDNLLERQENAIAVSAIEGYGCDALVEAVDSKLSRSMEMHELELAGDAGEAMAWLYRHGDVVERKDDEEGRVIFRVGLDAADFGRFQKRYS